MEDTSASSIRSATDDAFSDAKREAPRHEGRIVGALSEALETDRPIGMAIWEAAAIVTAL